MRLSQAVLSLALCTTLSSAWPWPPTIPNNGVLIRRQDDNKPTATQQSVTDNTSTDITSATDSSSSSDSNNSQTSDGGSSTGTITKGPTQSAKETSKSTTTKKPKINPVDPPGGISMISPPATTTTYYKIGDTVTFAWNYTSLQSTPTAINVLATNTAGTWTLANNQSMKETGKVVWDTMKDKNDPNHPLLTDTYTLVVYDASQDVTAIPQAGILKADNTFRFGMYLPAAYTDMDNFICATCNGAMSAMEGHTLKFLFGTALITVLSFTWFAGGFLGAL